jgi:hypothetical protein
VPGVGGADAGVYGWMYDAAIKRLDVSHRVVWRRCYGPIPRGLDVDHVCNVSLCQRADHLQLLTKPDNTRERWARVRRGGAKARLCRHTRASKSAWARRSWCERTHVSRT